jgi:hypothetical protein
VPGSVTDEPPPRPVPDRRRDTLAEGRPGSHRPLSEGPGRGAQRGSIAEDNPHADTKLSSASGARQEHRRDTLAEGRPGARIPLSTGRG